MNVKDLLDYEALPEETRRLAEAYWRTEVLKAQEEADEQYDKGYDAGETDSSNEIAGLEEEIEELKEKIASLEDDVELLKGDA